jgi:hypothetical protein
MKPSQLAIRIVNELFTSPQGTARRIQLRDEDECDLGGYCYSAALDVVETELRTAKRNKAARSNPVKPIKVPQKAVSAPKRAIR